MSIWKPASYWSQPASSTRQCWSLTSCSDRTCLKSFFVDINFQAVFTFINTDHKFSLLPLICYILYSLEVFCIAEFTAQPKTFNFCYSDELWLYCWLNILLMFQLTYFPGLWRYACMCLSGDDLWILNVLIHMHSIEKNLLKCKLWSISNNSLTILWH